MATIVKGINDLATTHPHLIAEWSPKNVLSPHEVTFGSKKTPLWICSVCSHEWNARISGRTGQNKGCPPCGQKKAVEGFKKNSCANGNDLKTKNPEMAAEFMVEKNGFESSEISFCSSQRVWWECRKCLLSYQNSPKNRVQKNRSCPYCAGQKVFISFNDVATTFPHLVAEWSIKNKINPTEVTSGSKTRILWECSKCRHEWVARIRNRSAQGNGCPKCSSGKTERAIVSTFSTLSGFNFESRSIMLERDMFISPKAQIDGISDTLNLVVEYDGCYYHGENNPAGHTIEYILNRDMSTTRALLEAGFKVIRIRERVTKDMLPMLPMEHENLLQLPFMLRGAKSDTLEGFVHRTISMKPEWFSA